MDGLADAFEGAAAERTAHGRWAPGRSGNPAGRKPGSRNRATLLRELLTEDDVGTAIRVLRERLDAGDAVAARFVLDRMFPKPRDRDIDLGLPPPEAGTTVADLLERALWLAAQGEITLDEATRFARLARQRAAMTAGAAVAARAAAAASPAFDLQTADPQTAGEDAEPAAAAPQPANRHQRRRAAALLRTLQAAGPPGRAARAA